MVLVEQVTLNAEIRTETGSSSCRKMRRSGIVPAVIYGHGEAARSICLEKYGFNRFWRVTIDYGDSPGFQRQICRRLPC